MAKVLFIVALLTVLAVVTMVATDDAARTNEQRREERTIEVGIRADRIRRSWACTIPVIGDWVGNSACVTYCVNKGKAGGYCNSDNECICSPRKIN